MTHRGPGISLERTQARIERQYDKSEAAAHAAFRESPGMTYLDHVDDANAARDAVDVVEFARAQAIKDRWKRMRGFSATPRPFNYRRPSGWAAWHPGQIAR